jgi:ATP-dependent RNA helicase RhlE
VTRHLDNDGIRAVAIHGNKSQPQRERALEDFRCNRIKVLVATDIAARGIDVDGISHVVNYELPNVPESYVHRIGRTARAGASGIAVAFCDPAERGLLRDIERLIGRSLPKQGPDGVAIAVDAEPIGRMPVREGSRDGSRKPRQNNGRPANGQRSNGQRSAGNQAQGQQAKGQQANDQARGRNGKPARSRNGSRHGEPQQGNGNRRYDNDDRRHAQNERRNGNEDRRRETETRREARPGNEAEDAGLARMLGAPTAHASHRDGSEPRRRRAA